MTIYISLDRICNRQQTLTKPDLVINCPSSSTKCFQFSLPPIQCGCLLSQLNSHEQLNDHESSRTILLRVLTLRLSIIYFPAKPSFQNAQ